LDELRILDQVEELRGCDKRLTACMLNRLGDLQFERMLYLLALQRVHLMKEPLQQRLYPRTWH
jgi:hypothetical protein